MLQAPLWAKVLFIVWVIAFIFIEAAWENITEWVGKKFKSRFRGPHFGRRLGPNAR